MFITSLHIENFRNFETASFRFEHKFSVMIGNNGTGKSSVLKAIQIALGAYLQSLTILPSQKPYRRNFRKSERRVWFDKDKKDYISANLLEVSAKPKVSVEAIININDHTENLTWSRSLLSSGTTTHKSPEKDQVQAYTDRLQIAWSDNQKPIFPVFANFETNRVLAQVRLFDKTWQRMSNLHKGYYSSLESNVNFTSVTNWLANYEKRLKDGKETAGTKDALFDAIKTAIPYIKEIDFYTSYKLAEFEIIIDFEDGQPIERKLLSNCSDGVNALFNVVVELGYRCIMLNGHLGKAAIAESTGVVTIDEIDMLLHPKWQRHVVADIHAAFPNIQFIGTSHSPFIIQSLDPSQLWNLDKITDVPLGQLSINTIATEIMGVDSKFSIENEETYQKIKSNGIEGDEVRNPAIEALLELMADFKK